MVVVLCFIALVTLHCSMVEAADTFTSLVHLHQSIQAEKDIIPHIETYLQDERLRLAQVERLLDSFKDHHAELSAGNMERHLSNPVNAYHVTRSMYDLITLSDEIISNNSLLNTQKFQNISASVRSQLPTKDDMDGAVLALLRLQDTYALETTQLADSNLGLESAADEALPLSAKDCFEIGKTAFVMSDHYHSVMWLMRSLEKYDQLKADGHMVDSELMTCLNYLNFALYKQNNLERALHTADRWVSMDGKADPGVSNAIFYEKTLKEKGLVYDADNLPALVNKQVRTGFSNTQEFRTYETLCQGGKVPQMNKTRNLMCYNSPMQYSYYPSFEEELSLDPRLVYFHHVLSEREVEHIKDLARPKLDRSGVFALNTDTPAGGVKTNTRVSKSAWLFDTEDEVISSLSLRFSRITGLTLDYAEALQVLNYGIGGHYEPHCDFARADNPNVFSNGARNRLATFILYLTNVEKGGATVFPRAGATVWPEMGGAAFWYNIHGNGDLDERTLHGACPVLVGYKWVCNKWFHESANEFTHPCLMEDNVEH